MAATIHRMLGIGEILFLVSIGVLVFGARKIPQLGSALGETIRMFRKSVKGKDEDAPKVRDVHEFRQKLPKQED